MAPPKLVPKADRRLGAVQPWSGERVGVEPAGCDGESRVARFSGTSRPARGRLPPPEAQKKVVQTSPGRASLARLRGVRWSAAIGGEERKNMKRSCRRLVGWLWLLGVMGPSAIAQDDPDRDPVPEGGIRSAEEARGDDGAPGRDPDPSQDRSTDAATANDSDEEALERWPKKALTIRLSLEDAVRIALEKNLDVRISRVGLWSAVHGVTIERSAFDPIFFAGFDFANNRRPTASFLDIGGGALAPTVQANPTKFTEFFASIGGLTPIGTTYELRAAETSFDRPAAAGTLFGINPQISSSARLQLTQPLLRGAWYPYNTGALRIARNNERLTVEQLEQAVVETVYAVEQAYWELAFALKNYEARRKSLEVASQDLRNTRRRESVGSVAALDVTIVESQVALRKVEFSEAELLLENSRDDLLDLLNFAGGRSLQKRWQTERPDPYDDILVVTASEPDSSRLVVERAESLGTAFDRRADFRQVAIDLDSQRIRVDLAKNEMMPKLDITGSWEQHGLAEEYDRAIRSLADGDFYSWAVGVRFEVPLSQRGPRNRYLQARDEVTRIRLEQAKLENRIILEVDRAIRTLESLEERVADLDDRVRLQSAILEAERKKLRAGTSISYTVSTIENDLIDSQAQALRAAADYETAKATYYRSVGTLLDRYRIGFSERSEDLEE